jgi:photosystem II stability/assembly factor-like uncharacterized protein
MRAALLLFACTLTAHAQWQILDAHTNADLRGVDNVGKGVVWASGTHGTVLRSDDNGTTWQHCTTPPDAEQLDFRGVQAFDANTAIVMSSGKGDLSRLYKTTDGCQTWKLVFSNQDPEGFWDALQFQHADFGLFSMPGNGILIGDPLQSSFEVKVTMNIPSATPPKQEGEAWFIYNPKDFPAKSSEAVFAASNSSLIVFGQSRFMFGTGGKSGARVISSGLLVGGVSDQVATSVTVPIASGTDSAGVFSLFAKDRQHIIAVGGDYLKPEDSTGTAALTTDGGKKWTASTIPPHGYRSAVAYDAATKTWITVGPNGTDISTDDGRNWRALKPGAGDAPDADQHWNALSLPFVVGPKGRIGILEPQALKSAAK